MLAGACNLTVCPITSSGYSAYRFRGAAAALVKNQSPPRNRHPLPPPPTDTDTADHQTAAQRGAGLGMSDTGLSTEAASAVRCICLCFGLMRHLRCAALSRQSPLHDVATREQRVRAGRRGLCSSGSGSECRFAAGPNYALQAPTPPDVELDDDGDDDDDDGAVVHAPAGLLPLPSLPEPVPAAVNGPAPPVTPVKAALASGAEPGAPMLKAAEEATAAAAGLADGVRAIQIKPQDEADKQEWVGMITDAVKEARCVMSHARARRC